MNYAAKAAKARSLLSRFGQQVTLRVASEGAYDPATSTRTEAQTDSPRLGAILNFGQGVTLVHGTEVQAGDQRLLLEATDGPAPQPQDRVLANGATYSVVSCSDVNPAGTPVLYDVHLRRA